MSDTIHIDPDELWRCFCLHNVRAGAVTNPFHMNYYNFLSLIHSCREDFPRHAKLSDGQLGVIFRSVAYETPAEMNRKKSMRQRINETTLQHNTQDTRRSQTHGTLYILSNIISL